MFMLHAAAALLRGPSQARAAARRLFYGWRRAYWEDQYRFLTSRVIEHDVLEPLPEVIRASEEDIIR